MDNKVVLGIVVLVVLLVAAYFLVGAPGVTASPGVPILLTDPPQVPTGTSALVIAYSSMQVHTGGGAGSGWVTAGGSGNIDLMTLINTSQTIATANVSSGSSVDMARFTVTSATITINGTTYNVTVPSGQVTAHITGKTTVNGTSSVLLDLAPTVAAIVTSNSTVFVLVPSVKAIVVSNGNSFLISHIGARANLNANVQAQLGQGSPNLNVTSASISVAPGNVTHISVTIKDDSNSSVTIQRFGIFGNESIRFNNTALQANAQAYVSNIASRAQSSGLCASASANASSSGGGGIFGHLGGGLNVTTGAGQAKLNSSSKLFLHIPGGGALQINNSICTQAGVTAIQQLLNQQILNVTVKLQANEAHFRMLVFGVQGNGALWVPSSLSGQTQAQYAQNAGITLQPSQSVTLTFNGVISPAQGHLIANFIAGQTYKVGVEGGESARVITSVTAAASSS